MSEHSRTAKHHVIPLRTYLAVGIALLILTAVTVSVSTINLGGWNAIVAVGIASVKATLVAFIFMHLLYDRKIFLVIFLTAITFLTAFLALTMFDTLSRGQIYSITEKPIHDKAAIYRDDTTDTLSTESDSLSPDSIHEH
jgi:cytochrome c oxidase subunit 4